MKYTVVWRKSAEDELAVIAMLLDAHYQKSLHALPAGEMEPEKPRAREPVKARDQGPRGGGSGDARRRRR